MILCWCRHPLGRRYLCHILQFLYYLGPFFLVSLHILLKCSIFCSYGPLVCLQNRLHKQYLFVQLFYRAHFFLCQTLVRIYPFYLEKICSIFLYTLDYFSVVRNLSAFLFHCLGESRLHASAFVTPNPVTVME